MSIGCRLDLAPSLRLWSYRRLCLTPMANRKPAPQLGGKGSQGGDARFADAGNENGQGGNCHVCRWMRNPCFVFSEATEYLDSTRLFMYKVNPVTQSFEPDLRARLPFKFCFCSSGPISLTSQRPSNLLLLSFFHTQPVDLGLNQRFSSFALTLLRHASHHISRSGSESRQHCP